MRRTLTVLLLTFVVFTAGFAVGKEVGARRAIEAMPPAASTGTSPAVGAATAEASTPERVLEAWYFHATKRCVTCNTIEAYAKEGLEDRFPMRLLDGEITWQTANMDDVWNEDAVRRYGLIRSSLVLIEKTDGVETDHAVLNRVWDLTGDKEAFFDYLQSEVEMFVDGWAYEDEGDVDVDDDEERAE